MCSWNFSPLEFTLATSLLLGVSLPVCGAGCCSRENDIPLPEGQSFIIAPPPPESGLQKILSGNPRIDARLRLAFENALGEERLASDPRTALVEKRLPGIAIARHTEAAIAYYEEALGLMEPEMVGMRERTEMKIRTLRLSLRLMTDLNRDLDTPR